MSLAQLSEYLRGWSGKENSGVTPDEVALFNASLIAGGTRVIQQ